MKTLTFTINKKIIRINYLINTEIWCEEIDDWIYSDEEKYKEEMKLNKKEQCQ